MVNPMGGNPGNRSALQRQRAANGKEILKSQRHLVRPVRVQAMVAHADAQTGGSPVKENRNGEGVPVEHEQRGDGPYVEDRHHDADGPVDSLMVRNPDDFSSHSNLLKCGGTLSGYQ